MEVHGQLGTGRAREFVDARRCPRFKLEVDIRIYPRGGAVIRGKTVDISESGIAAMLVNEVALGKVVRLEFVLPPGFVEVRALVRQRNAFRYGFQFIDPSSAHEIISRTCRELAVEQAVKGPNTV